jgi:hypothetical protein
MASWTSLASCFSPKVNSELRTEMAICRTSVLVGCPCVCALSDSKTSAIAQKTQPADSAEHAWCGRCSKKASRKLSMPQSIWMITLTKHVFAPARGAGRRGGGEPAAAARARQLAARRGARGRRACGAHARAARARERSTCAVEQRAHLRDPGQVRAAALLGRRRRRRRRRWLGAKMAFVVRRRRRRPAELGVRVVAGGHEAAGVELVRRRRRRLLLPSVGGVGELLVLSLVRARNLRGQLRVAERALVDGRLGWRERGPCALPPGVGSAGRQRLRRARRRAGGRRLRRVRAEPAVDRRRRRVGRAARRLRGAERAVRWRALRERRRLLRRRGRRAPGARSGRPHRLRLRAGLRGGRAPRAPGRGLGRAAVAVVEVFVEHGLELRARRLEELVAGLDRPLVL